MKDNKLQGVDGIAPKILKETGEQISMSLAHTCFNMSLQEGIDPLEWKEANTISLLQNIQETRLSQQIQVDKPFSAWVLKSKILSNKFDMLFFRK